MSVSNGQEANQTTFNSAFISRTQDSDTIGKVGLNNTSDVNSGAQIMNAQRLINEVRDATGVAGEGDTTRKTYSSANYVADGDDRKVAIGKLDAGLAVAAQDASDALAEATDIRLLTGTATGETDLGTFTGSTIADNGNIKQALQDLEDEVELKLDASEKGAASGVCPLDGTSKIPSAYLPSTLQELKGNWNASTNSPTLVDGTGDVGDTYRVSVAGTQNLGSGSVTYEVGDWIYYASGVWYKLDATDAVTSVQGLQGAVSLDSDDIPEGSTNEYWTNAKFDTRLGSKSIDALSDVDTTTVAPSINDVLKWDGTKWAPGTGGSGGGGNFTAQRFSGDGSTTAFTLSSSPGAEENTQVYISGVYQQKDTYSVAGTTLTFSAAPPTGTDNIEVMIGSTVSIGTPSDGTVSDAKTNFTPPSRQIFTSGSGTYTKPSTVKWIRIKMSGGGGGGGGAAATGASQGACGGGGGAGGYLEKVITSPSSSYSYAVGAAGTGSSGASGGTGGNSTFDTLTASGGTGGTVGAAGTNSSANGGAGGSASGGDVNITGQTGHTSLGGNGIGQFVGGGGGSNPIGLGGASIATSSAGRVATGYGGGGGGASIGQSLGAQAGGAGTAGIIIVEEHYQ